MLFYCIWLFETIIYSHDSKNVSDMSSEKFGSYFDLKFCKFCVKEKWKEINFKLSVKYLKKRILPGKAVPYLYVGIYHKQKSQLKMFL